MATLAFSLAGQMVGGALGGPLGATIGRAVGGLAGNAVDQALFAPKPPQRVGTDLRVQGASEGGVVPRVYGWSRVAGNVIWATDLERIAASGSGAKAMGGGIGEDEAIAANFALALCAGEVAHLGRIWADGKLLETEGLTIRFHRGGADQQPDGLIEAKQGAGNAPAYRGVAYLVFEALPLAPFGNRIPNLTVEICRPVGDLERRIRAVCVIPGSTEFGYDPVPRVEVIGPGATRPENAHIYGARANWDVSISELVDLCPGLEHVALVVSWFGTDLRCSQCVTEPRVEAHGREIAGVEWGVAGLAREEANVVTTFGGGPAYGGTPSDAAVRAAIADLKARGLKVTLYPFMMMDIPHDNALPDPYGGGTGQSAYPWRGRITCDPAPGRPGSPDGGAGGGAQVAAFMDNGYHDLVLHYARLAVEAGGVDAMVIGSELRGLTSVRSGPASFPFVDALKALAGAVRAIVGAGTKITYAADWSEYSGLQPAEAPGDKIFHLDPLWADANIDAVGIDCYMPLSDWRDGRDHADAAHYPTPYDADYLAGNIAGGEGFDFFYASDADRRAGLRTPVTDGAHGEPWVYRYKDLVNWWSQPHHDRIGGIRSPTPTAWQPASKPIWLTELGCGAVDKGGNAPNAFGDPKSSEDLRPYFSSGAPDALMQRQFLRACHDYWHGADAARNPVSGLYGGAMLDTDRIYLWCWDARPYPAFPALDEVWADAANHPTGHWLNGRIGAAATDEILRAMAADYGVALDRLDAVPPLVAGATIEDLASLRDASAAIVEAAGLFARDGIAGMSFVRPDDRSTLALTHDDLVRGEGAVVSRRRGDPNEAAGRMVMRFLDREKDYQVGTVTALGLRTDRVSEMASGLVLEPGSARKAAETALAAAGRGGDTLDWALPPSRLALEPGDVVALAGIEDGPFVIGEVRDRLDRAMNGAAYPRAAALSVAVDAPGHAPTLPVVPAAPLVSVAHLPDAAGGSEMAIAVYASPWPGEVTVRQTDTGGVLARLREPARMGVLAHGLDPGPTGVWISGPTLAVQLHDGHLASASDAAVLGGANRLLIEGEDGRWEAIGFATAHLTAPGTYALDRVLRGLEGSPVVTAPAGGRVVVRDAALARAAMPAGQAEGVVAARVYAGRLDGAGAPLTVATDTAPLRPLAPCHLRAVRDPASGDIVMGWIRRSRIGGNDWTHGDVPLDHAPERYRVAIIVDGATRRSVDVRAPAWTYSAAEQQADFGAPAHDFTIAVVQASAVHGPGHIATGAFHD